VPSTPSAVSDAIASRLGAALGKLNAATGAAMIALAAIVAATIATGSIPLSFRFR
jgi:hypothetical protein